MAKRQETRAHIRLQLDRGVVLLRLEGKPTIACSLEDLSEGGCRCHVPLEAVDEQTAKDWRDGLQQGKLITISLTSPPYLSRIVLKAEIAHVRAVHVDNLSLGLRFINPTEGLQKTLRDALLKLATSKVRRAFGGGRSSAELEAVPAELGEEPVTITPASSKSNDRLPKVPDPQKLSNTGIFKGRSLADILVSFNVMTAMELSDAEEKAQRYMVSLEKYLVSEGLLSPVDLARVQSLRSGLPVVDLEKVRIPDSVQRRFGFLTMQRFSFVPFQETEYMICIAAAAPLADDKVSDLEGQVNKSLVVFMAPQEQIHERLFKMQPRRVTSERAFERHSATLPVFFQFCDERGVLTEGIQQEGTTRDLSQGGLSLEGAAIEGKAPKDLGGPDAFARVAFMCPPHELHAICKICSVIKQREPEFPELPWMYRMQFVVMPDQDRELLKAACQRMGLWQARKGD